MGNCLSSELPLTQCPGNEAYEALERKWLGIPDEAILTGQFSGCGCEVGCWPVDDVLFVNSAGWAPYPKRKLGTRWMRPSTLPGRNTKTADGLETAIVTGQTYRVPTSIWLERAAVHQADGRECWGDATCEAWPPVCGASTRISGPICLDNGGFATCVDANGHATRALGEVLDGKWADVFFSSSPNLRGERWCRLSTNVTGPTVVEMVSPGVLARPMYAFSTLEGHGTPTPAGHSINPLIACIERMRAPTAPCSMAAANRTFPPSDDYYSGAVKASHFQHWGLFPDDMPHFLTDPDGYVELKNTVLAYALRDEGLSIPGGPVTRLDRVDHADQGRFDAWSRQWTPGAPSGPGTYDETRTEGPIEANVPLVFHFHTPPSINDDVADDETLSIPIGVFASFPFIPFDITVNGVDHGSQTAINLTCDGGGIGISIAMTVGEWRTLVPAGSDATIVLTPSVDGGDCPEGAMASVRLSWTTNETVPQPVSADQLPIAYEFDGRLARSGRPVTVEARLHYARLDLSLMPELFDDRPEFDPVAPVVPRLIVNARIELHCKLAYTAWYSDGLPDDPPITNATFDFDERPMVDGDTIIYAVDGEDMRLPAPAKFSWWGWLGHEGKTVEELDRWDHEMGHLTCCGSGGVKGIRSMLVGTEIAGWPTHIETDPQDPRKVYGGRFVLQATTAGCN